MPTSLVEGALMDTQESVLATFDFLSNENVVDDDEENLRYETLCVCNSFSLFQAQMQLQSIYMYRKCAENSAFDPGKIGVPFIFGSFSL